MAAKNYSATFLYNKYPYEENIFKFIMTGTQIPVMDDTFEDVKYEFKKRQIHPSLLKVLMSRNVILLVNPTNLQLNRQFRVFCSKDVKSKTNDIKAFIDVTGLIYKEEKTGNYKCRNIDILISNVINAMVSLIYHKAETKLLTVGIVNDGMSIFSSLFTYVIDYLTKISTIPSSKSKCQYLACMYYVENIIGHPFNDNYKSVAGKITQLSEREQQMIIAQVDDDDFINIKLFVEKLADILRFPSLKIDNLVDKWMFLYGQGTPFALEYFPALSAMVTDAYVGAYINNQKTIEKVTGNAMVTYTKNILEKGGQLV